MTAVNNHRSAATLFGCLVLLLPLMAIGLFLRTTPSEFSRIKSHIKKHDDTLTSSAKAFRSGVKTTATTSGIQFFPDYIDRNNNVYFIMFSNTFSNRGFVYRNGNAPLLEDGVEPNIIETRHIVDDWWFYIGS